MATTHKTTPVNMVQVIAEARSYLGVPWRHRGRDRSGIDCVGIIILPFLAAGWVPRHPDDVHNLDYPHRAVNDHVLDTLRGEGDAVPLNALQPGDVAAFLFDGDEFAQHVGLITARRGDGTLYLLHADSEKGSVVEHRLSWEWRKCLVAAFRLGEFSLQEVV